VSLEPFGVEVGLDVLAETVGIQFSGGGARLMEKNLKKILITGNFRPS